MMYLSIAELLICDVNGIKKIVWCAFWLNFLWWIFFLNEKYIYCYVFLYNTWVCMGCVRLMKPIISRTFRFKGAFFHDLNLDWVDLSILDQKDTIIECSRGNSCNLFILIDFIVEWHKIDYYVISLSCFSCILDSVYWLIHIL